MSLAEFVDNLSDLDDGENFPYDVLANLYHSIRRDPLEFEMYACFCKVLFHSVSK